MKTSVYVRLLAVASVALAPFAAIAQDADVKQACVDAFVAQNFPGQTPVIKVERDTMRLPLVFNSGSVSMKLSAADGAGRVLVAATCTEKRGVVTLSPDERFELIAGR